MTTLLAVVGRLLIALLFIVSGVSKLFYLAGTQGMLSSVGLPAGFALPVGLFELIAGLALVFGVLTRLVAVLLAAFCLLTAFFFHNNFVDPTQAAMLLKNVAIAGGLLCLCALDTVRWSYDAMRERRLAEQAAVKAEHRVHDAEVRAARAEGAAAAARTPDSGEVARPEIDGEAIPLRRRRWL